MLALKISITLNLAPRVSFSTYSVRQTLVAPYCSASFIIIGVLGSICHI